MRIYASNTGDASVTVYDIETDPKTQVELQKIVLPTAGGTYQFALSANEDQLVVLTQRYQATTPKGSGKKIQYDAVPPNLILKLQSTFQFDRI